MQTAVFVAGGEKQPDQAENDEHDDDRRQIGPILDQQRAGPAAADRAVEPGLQPQKRQRDRRHDQDHAAGVIAGAGVGAGEKRADDREKTEQHEFAPAEIQAPAPAAPGSGLSRGRSGTGTGLRSGAPAGGEARIRAVRPVARSRTGAVVWLMSLPCCRETAWRSAVRLSPKPFYHTMSRCFEASGALAPIFGRTAVPAVPSCLMPLNGRSGIPRPPRRFRPRRRDDPGAAEPLPRQGARQLRPAGRHGASSSRPTGSAPSTARSPRSRSRGRC